MELALNEIAWFYAAVSKDLQAAFPSSELCRRSLLGMLRVTSAHKQHEAIFMDVGLII